MALHAAISAAPSLRYGEPFRSIPGVSPSSSQSSRISYPTKLSSSSACAVRSPVCAVSSASVAADSPWLSNEDEILQRNHLVLRTDIDGIDLDGLNSLFARVRFQARDKTKLRRALENSSRVFWLCEAGSSGTTAKPVAFCRATGDDVFNAVVWDVAVDPNRQGKGLGRTIMSYLVASLLEAGITNICLYAETGVATWYKPQGWCVDPDGIRGMAYRPKKK